MRKTQHIKLFSHNDLDGFGAPCLFYALAPYMFKGVEFDLTTCSAGNLDRELEHWFKEPDILRYTDVYIMDMTPENVTPSAVSLVWDFMTRQPNFALVPKQKQKELAELVEMIRAYDTWDFQNDKNMSYEERKAADELNQLFWFFPLSKSKSFVDSVFASGWEKYRIEHELLISTLEGRRQRYLDKHLKNVETFEIEGHGFGVVYASDYKSEIAHELLKKYDVDAALVIDSHSVSLRSNGRLDVAKFAEDYFRGGGHADSAGGRLEVEPIKAAEQAVIESVKQRAKLNEEVASQNEDETSSLGDALDPEMAAKLASLFGNDGK